jgi:hypothetical protein
MSLKMELISRATNGERRPPRRPPSRFVRCALASLAAYSAASVSTRSPRITERLRIQRVRS